MLNGMAGSGGIPLLRSTHCAILAAGTGKIAVNDDEYSALTAYGELIDPWEALFGTMLVPKV